MSEMNKKNKFKEIGEYFIKLSEAAPNDCLNEENILFAASCTLIYASLLIHASSINEIISPGLKFGEISDTSDHNINTNTVHLCNSCLYNLPDCPSDITDIVFGDSVGKDNVLCCSEYFPERKKGRWIPVDSYSAFGGDESTWIAHGNPIAFYYCSECKGQAYAGEDGSSLLTDFCPNCGADMRGKTNEV